MAEARLDITGSSDTAQRALDSATRALAKVREENRRLNIEAAKGFKDSTRAIEGFAEKLSQASTSTGRWADGMKRLQVQTSLTKSDFSVLSSAMQKIVVAKEPFGPWAQGLERLKSSQDRWSQGLKTLQEQQNSKKKGGLFGVSMQDFDAISDAMSSVATRVIGIGAAVGLVWQGYATWEQKVQDVTERHNELSTAITRTLAESGKLSLGPKAEKFIKGVKGATPKQATAALAGVLESGETLSDERAFAVAEKVAPLGATGMEMIGAGKLAADVADILGEDVSAEDVADITVAMKQMLREKTETFSGRKFQKQIEAVKTSKKMTGMDAIAHAISALQSEQGAEAMKVLAHKGGPLSTDQLRMRREAFDPANVAEIKQKLEQAATGNAAAAEIQSLGAFQSGRETLQEQRTQEEEAMAAEQHPDWAALARIRRTISARASQRQGLLSSASWNVMQGINNMVGAVGGTGYIGRAEIGQARNQGLISASEAAQFTAALKEAADASREVARKRSGPNVDAHRE